MTSPQPVAANPDLPPPYFITPPCQVVRNQIYGQPICFTITNPKDSIQRYHVLGQFYEAEELEIIRKHFRPGSVFCDMGANIGNHTLFAMKFLHASTSILFEPNPEAIAILRSNMELNGLTDRVDLSHLGVGVSDEHATGFHIDSNPRNLGGAKLVPGGGTVETERGDVLLADRHVDFIKMDIEGMELRALAGLEKTIARCRPGLFVEVDKTQTVKFRNWAAERDYVIRARYVRYETKVNFLAEPATAPGESAV
jgi:FkbM family methyltransferase